MVSVIIPTYRRSDSLINALKSLVEQTYKDFEVIIIDDNIDEEWNKKIYNIVNQFKEQLHINYIKNISKQGSANSRNIGIFSSRGDFITFLDDDDLYLPQKIEHQLKSMLDNDADFSIMNIKLYYENDELFETRKRDYLNTEEANNLMVCHMKYHMTGTDTLMFKKEYIQSFGGFVPIDMGDEFYLMVRAIENNGKIAYCDECDVKAYIHRGESQGLSNGQGKIDGEKRLFKFKKKYFHLLKNKDKRYIRMRYFAVLAYAYKRSNKLLKFLLFGICSVLAAPIQSIKLLKSLRTK